MGEESVVFGCDRPETFPVASESVNLACVILSISHVNSEGPAVARDPGGCRALRERGSPVLPTTFYTVIHRTHLALRKGD